VARLGVTLVIDEWEHYLKDVAPFLPRASPGDGTHDLHINVVQDMDGPQVCRSYLCSPLPSVDC
jgi:hypothetical protein